MRAWILERQAPIEDKPLRQVDIPDPTPGPGEVRIRVRACGVCRTDLHIVEGDLPVSRSPIIPGHQVVGTVDSVGPGVETPELGARVGIAWLRDVCTDCEFCAAGRENLCPASVYTGYHEHGGYAEFAVVPARFAYGIPSVFGDEEAAPLLCAGIIGYRALRRAQLPPGGRLLLVGFGSSAHVVLQLARARGHEVYVVSRGSNHLRLARRMGATWAGAPGDTVPTKVHSAIIFAPAGHTVPPTLEAVTRGGTVALAGIHMSSIPPLDYDRHLFHEKTLQSVEANTRADGDELLAEAANIPIRPRVTAFPFEKANEALLALKDGSLNGSGILALD